MYRLGYVTDKKREGKSFTLTTPEKMTAATIYGSLIASPLAGQSLHYLTPGKYPVVEDMTGWAGILSMVPAGLLTCYLVLQMLNGSRWTHYHE